MAIDLICLNKTVSKGDLVKTFVKDIKLLMIFFLALDTT